MLQNSRPLLPSGSHSVFTSVAPSQELAKKNGAVYTPELLAEYVARKAVCYALNGKPSLQSKISVVDPAVGDGILLESIAHELLKHMKVQGVAVTISGLDISPKAIEESKKRLSALPKPKTSIHLTTANSLHPKRGHSLLEYWKDLSIRASLNERFDMLIANPPWGADTSEFKGDLKNSDYLTLQGQFDSFELFMELATKIVAPEGHFAFIVPDSILNHGKSILRDILINKTEIKFIARLGEKFFPGVNRACVVIICKNSPAPKNHMVDCFRLGSTFRKKILKGESDFYTAEKSNLHKVPQDRFRTNNLQCFDIDLRQVETALVRTLKRTEGKLGDRLSISRGVELGSSGKICACKFCSSWMPMSDQAALDCLNCGKTFSPAHARQETIVVDKRMANASILARGSDMKRYSYTPTKWIKLGYDGINYKEASLYKSPKILIRKTGVGITATLDYDNAYTNQVVYMAKPRFHGEDLEFYLGLLNSRAYYFYLIKAYGELEWKSHPYLTQSQVVGLPLPNMETKKNRLLCSEIANLLKPVLKNKKTPSDAVDAKVEGLVGELFGLTKDDYRIIFDAINDSDDLLPVRELKKIGVVDIFRK